MTNPKRANLPKTTKSKTSKNPKPAAKIQKKEPPKRASQPKLVQQAKRCERLNTTADVADIAIDTPPSSPISTTESNANICVSLIYEQNIFLQRVSKFVE